MAWYKCIGQNGGGEVKHSQIIFKYSNTTSGDSTYTIPEDGLYAIVVSNSLQGSRGITLPSGRTRLVNQDVTAGSNPYGMLFVIAELEKDDVITLSAEAYNWNAFSKQVFLLKNIIVNSVHGTSGNIDGQYQYSVPSTIDNYFVLGLCFGRLSSNYRNDTVETTIPKIKIETDNPDTVNTDTIIYCDKGYNIPELDLYGYDGGGAFFISLGISFEGETTPIIVDRVNDILTARDLTKVTASSFHAAANCQEWYAFDGEYGSTYKAWLPEQNDAPCWLRYEFSTAKYIYRVKLFYASNLSGSFSGVVKIQGSNDDNTWTDISNNEIISFSGANPQSSIIECDSSQAWKYVRLYSETCLLVYNSASCLIHEMEIIGAVSGEVIDINEIVKLTQSEYDNLATKEDDKLYQIYDAETSIIYKTYKGLIPFSKYKTPQEINSYDFYCEDLKFNYSNPSSSKQPKIYLETDIELLTSTNEGRNWEMDFSGNANNVLDQNTMVGHTYQGAIQFFFRDSMPNKIGIFGDFSKTSSTTTWYDYINGQDMKIIQENGVIKIIINGIEVDSYSKLTHSTYSGKVLVGTYTTQPKYLFSGVINYFGFKWLS